MKTIALVMGAFHRARVEEMLDEAERAASEHGLAIAARVWVQGSLEKPLALKRLLLRRDVHGAAALGIIERGETKHGLVMGQAVLSSLLAFVAERHEVVAVEHVLSGPGLRTLYDFIVHEGLAHG